MADASNLSEGLRCYEKAKIYFINRKFDLADRLCSKALRMVVSDAAKASEIRSFHERIIQEMSSQKKSSQQATQNPSKSAEKISEAPSYEAGLERKCRSIVLAKDYYKILGLARDASQEDIKKAYRRLALQIHPDKSKCPSAEAAFKEISKAYQCLSNAEARQYYDTHGFEESNEQPTQNQYNAHFMTPEELFESFFHTAFSQGGVRHSTHTHRRQHNTYNLVQILPLIILLFIFMVSSLFGSHERPPFSFTSSSSYSMARTTRDHKILYYVDSSFYRTYTESSRKLRYLELQIEMDFFSTECFRELEQHYQNLQRLRYYGTNKQYRKKLQEIQERERDSHNCKNFNLLKKSYPGIYDTIRRSSRNAAYSYY